MLTEPKPMQEIHEIREKLYEENKNLTHKEHIDKVHKEAEEIKKKYGLVLKTRASAYLDEFPDEDEYKIAKTYKEIQIADKKLLKEYGCHTSKKLPPYKEK